MNHIVYRVDTTSQQCKHEIGNSKLKQTKSAQINLPSI